DAMLEDGLFDPYGRFHMGQAGEASARALAISRAEQDGFARSSYERARRAQADGAFDAEIEPVALVGPTGESTLSVDEEPQRVDLERMGSLPGVFERGGSITAANASKISDGAAAVVLASAAFVE